MAIALNVSLRLSCSLQGLLYLNLSISQLPIVQTPVMSNSIAGAILRYHLAFYVAFKLHVATKLLLDSKLLDSAHSVVTMAAH